MVVTNTPGVLTDATADLAMALVLMTTRRLGAAERRVRTGEPWGWSMTAGLGTGLRGKTLGIVGPGAIGLATARRATAFGMEVLLSGRRTPTRGWSTASGPGSSTSSSSSRHPTSCRCTARSRRRRTTSSAPPSWRP